ncbi:MAG: preprotein translocase subunit YajC [Fusobacteriia bacterium 4572_132]|nr:MAG: preprotein translocase subunit YajC [Fusobacteriia bacterium 4572_132]
MGLNSFIIYAVETAPKTIQKGNILSLVLPIVIWVAIFYFLLIRPNKKKTEAHQEMINSLKKGSNVITRGGIKGEIVSITEGFYEIRVDKGVKLTIKKSAVSSVIE